MSKIKTRYKFIHFQDMGTEWVCFNNKSMDVLCTVEFYKPWKQYVCSFSEGVVFSAGCLDDMSNFVKQLEKGENL